MPISDNTVKSLLFSRAYLLDLKQNTYEFTVITEPDEIELDKIDIGILALLAPNARTQIVEIASKLKVTSKNS